MNNRRGFTLVEVMVSMVIGSMVLLAAVAVLRATGDGYERLGGGVGAEREARALLGQIQADLATACFHEDVRIDKGAESWPLGTIGFLTLQPDDSQLDENRIGDLCAVRYYVKDQKVGGKIVRCLMRGFTESNETFEKLKSGSVESLFQEQSSTASSDTDEAIAFGVVSFEVTPKTREESGRLSDWQDKKVAPDAVAVRLVVARRELMGKLADSASWSGKGRLASLLGLPAEAERNKNLQVYETIVRFGHHEEN